MTKVILCCSAGMSTSLFVSKMKKHAEEINTQIDITAIPLGDLDDYLKDDSIDVIALAPQVKFQQATIAAKTSKPTFVIEMRDYGLMDVKKVLPSLLAAAGKA
ncbi:MAG: PTS sugar transporter subunit IIB [Brevinema sp.]